MVLVTSGLKVVTLMGRLRLAMVTFCRVELEALIAVLTRQGSLVIGDIVGGVIRSMINDHLKSKKFSL